MSEQNTDLYEKIIARANFDNLPDNHELRLAGISFNENSKGFLSEIQTCDIKKFMGSWARARMLWCDYSGESLI